MYMHTYMCMLSIYASFLFEATFKEADEKAEKGMETSHVEDSGSDEERSGRGKRVKT